MSDGPETTICWTVWNMERGTTKIYEFLKGKTILRSEFISESWAVKLTIAGAHDIGPELHAYYNYVTGDVQEDLL